MAGSSRVLAWVGVLYPQRTVLCGSLRKAWLSSGWIFITNLSATVLSSLSLRTAWRYLLPRSKGSRGPHQMRLPNPNSSASKRSMSLNNLLFFINGSVPGAPQEQQEIPTTLCKIQSLRVHALDPLGRVYCGGLQGISSEIICS